MKASPDKAAPKAMKATPKVAPKARKAMKKATPKAGPKAMKAMKATPEAAPKAMKATKKATPKAAPKAMKAMKVTPKRLTNKGGERKAGAPSSYTVVSKNLKLKKGEKKKVEEQLKKVKVKVEKVEVKVKKADGAAPAPSAKAAPLATCHPPYAITCAVCDLQRPHPPLGMPPAAVKVKVEKVEVKTTKVEKRVKVKVEQLEKVKVKVEKEEKVEENMKITRLAILRVPVAPRDFANGEGGGEDENNLANAPGIHRRGGFCKCARACVKRGEWILPWLQSDYCVYCKGGCDCGCLGCL